MGKSSQNKAWLLAVVGCTLAAELQCADAHLDSDAVVYRQVATPLPLAGFWAVKMTANTIETGHQIIVQLPRLVCLTCPSKYILVCSHFGLQRPELRR